MAVYCQTVPLVQVPLRRRRGPLGLGWRRVAGDQAIASGPGAEPVAAQHPPYPIGGEPDAAPLGPGEFGGDAGWPEAGMAEGEGHPRCSTSTLV